jgi:hypothetical protein
LAWVLNPSLAPWILAPRSAPRPMAPTLAPGSVAPTYLPRQRYLDAPFWLARHLGAGQRRRPLGSKDQFMSPRGLNVNFLQKRAKIQKKRFIFSLISSMLKLVWGVTLLLPSTLILWATCWVSWATSEAHANVKLFKRKYKIAPPFFHTDLLMHVFYSKIVKE